ncbi:hypothetical protein RQP46_000664 [Phenoliferia psychrophenolica]
MVLPTLPEDVLHHIIDESIEDHGQVVKTWFFKRRTLLVLSLVNRAFHHHAQQVLFRHIIIGGFKDLHPLAGVFFERPAMALAVRSIHLRSGGRERERIDDWAHLSSIIVACSKLREITIGGIFDLNLSPLTLNAGSLKYLHVSLCDLQMTAPPYAQPHIQRPTTIKPQLRLEHLSTLVWSGAYGSDDLELIFSLPSTALPSLSTLAILKAATGQNAPRSTQPIFPALQAVTSLILGTQWDDDDISYHESKTWFFLDAVIASCPALDMLIFADGTSPHPLAADLAAFKLRTLSLLDVPTIYVSFALEKENHLPHLETLHLGPLGTGDNQDRLRELIKARGILLSEDRKCGRTDYDGHCEDQLKLESE